MAEPGRVRRALTWLGSHELESLVSVATLTAGALLFLEVVAEVSDGSSRDFDRWLLLALRNPHDVTQPLGPLWVQELMRDLTALGGVAVLGSLTLAVIGYLVLMRRPRTAYLVMFAVVGGFVLNTLLKQFFSRPRPDLVTHLSHVSSASFPSGHTMSAAAVYLTLGTLLAQLQTGVLPKAYVLLWSWLLAFFVGISRVYVGVHWPTDVLAGWAAGGAWASLCWLLARRLRARGKVEC